MQKEYLNLADKLVDDNLTIYFDTEKFSMTQKVITIFPRLKNQVEAEVHTSRKKSMN